MVDEVFGRKEVSMATLQAATTKGTLIMIHLQNCEMVGVEGGKSF